MTTLAHLSKVKIQKEPGKNKIKRIQFDGFPETTRMGIHGGVADFFKLQPDEPLPSTLDYVVGAVAGCLTGVITAALEARGVRTDSAKFEADAEGAIENVDGQLLLTSVKVTYRIKAPKDQRAAIERALEHHESRCPVSQSVKRGITVEWRSEIETEP